jgi:thiol:disulfide interchange protein DsbA
MLKRFTILLGCFALFACDAFADKTPTSKFVAGTHYEVVAATATKQPEVREFFSFFCGHCYHFEPAVQKLSKALPAGVELQKNHVDFIQAASPEVQNAMARGYLVGQAAGKGDEIASLIFHYIHETRGKFTSTEDIRSLLLINNFDAQAFDSKFNSLPVLSAAQQMKDQQTLWSSTPSPADAKMPVLAGVPMLLVNGKYQVKLAALDKEKFDQELAELVTYLLQKKD